MKKSLLAVAAMSAFAGAAQAQSSVTVYGILDVGFQGVTSRGPAGTSSSASQMNTNTNITRFSGEGAEQTSRLGFKGTEDLGSGTSAFFTVEFGITPTDATLSGQTGNGLFNRQSFVGVKKNGIGQAAIGTQYTPIHVAVGRTDPGAQNNMIGNVIYTTNASQGSGQTTTSYTTRYNNALTLETARMAGFVVSAIYNNNNAAANNQTSAFVNGTTAGAGEVGYSAANNTAYGFGLNYQWQKLNVDAAFQASKNITVNGNTVANAALPASASAASVNLPANPMGTNANMAQTYAGVTYDFGILKAYAQYLNNKVVSNNTSTNAYIQRTAQQIGVRSYITPTVEAWASIGNGRFTGNGTTIVAGNPTVNFTGYQVGSNYYLSKRTNLYAIFGSTQTSTGSATVISEGGSSYGVGVRHTF